MLYPTQEMRTGAVTWRIGCAIVAANFRPRSAAASVGCQIHRPSSDSSTWFASTHRSNNPIIHPVPASTSGASTASCGTAFTPAPACFEERRQKLTAARQRRKSVNLGERQPRLPFPDNETVSNN